MEGAADPDACAVCCDGGWEDGDLIMFCDGAGCLLAVHQKCYGVQDIPEGEWFCDVCIAHGNSQNMQCIFCFETGGAFKQAQDGRWVQ